MTSPIEVESKFTIPSTSLADVFRVHRLGDFLRVEDRQSRHTDIYLDTDDGALRGHDVALRLRDVAGGPLLAGFKGAARELREGEVGIHRPEIEHEVARDAVDLDASSFPIGLYAELPSFATARDLVGDVMIHAVARIFTGRRSAVLARTTGGTAELSIDRTVGVRLSDGARHEFIEIELEISEDAVADFRTLNRDLRAQAPDLVPATLTKLERVLENAE